MKKFIVGLIFGAAAALTFAPEPEPEMCVESTTMTCSAAKVAASKVCDCQIVCYEEGK